MYTPLFLYSPLPHSLPPSPLSPQFALLLFEIVLLVVHCLSKPYEKKWINIVEALILLDLFVATAAILQSSDHYITQGLILLLVLLPYLYGVLMAVYLMGRYCWRVVLCSEWEHGGHINWWACVANLYIFKMNCMQRWVMYIYI